MPLRQVYPRGDLVTLQDAMDRLFEDSSLLPTRRWADQPRERSYRLPLDVYSTSEEIVLTASLPGLTPEEVNISINGDRLTVEGELRAPLENVEYVFRERPYGKFTRVLTLNVPIDVNKVEAEYENGILTLVLPKAEESKPKVIKVSSN